MASKRLWLAGAAALALALAAGLAAAASTGGGDMLQACARQPHGQLRLVATPDACRAHERPVSWSAAGAAGAGLASLDELAGLPCTAAGGGSGETELETSPGGVVTIRCQGDGGGQEGQPKLVINEIDYDQAGTDHDGFVELFNAGDAEAALDGLALVLVNGGDSAEYRRLALAGTLAPGEYRVWDTDPQNGPDGVALVDVAAAALLDALSYEGPIVDALIGGVTFSLVEGTALPADVADSNTVEGSLSRIPNGSDSDDTASDWRFTTTATRGGANVLTE